MTETTQNIDINAVKQRKIGRFRSCTHIRALRGFLKNRGVIENIFKLDTPVFETYFDGLCKSSGSHWVNLLQNPKMIQFLCEKGRNSEKLIEDILIFISAANDSKDNALELLGSGFGFEHLDALTLFLNKNKGNAIPFSNYKKHISYSTIPNPFETIPQIDKCLRYIVSLGIDLTRDAFTRISQSRMKCNSFVSEFVFGEPCQSSSTGKENKFEKGFFEKKLDEIVNIISNLDSFAAAKEIEKKYNLDLFNADFRVFPVFRDITNEFLLVMYPGEDEKKLIKKEIGNIYTPHVNGALSFARFVTVEREGDASMLVTLMQTDLFDKRDEDLTWGRFRNSLPARLRKRYNDWNKIMWNVLEDIAHVNRMSTISITASDYHKRRWREQGFELHPSTAERIYDTLPSSMGCTKSKIKHDELAASAKMSGEEIEIWEKEVNPENPLKSVLKDQKNVMTEYEKELVNLIKEMMSTENN